MPVEAFEISLVDIGVATWHTTAIETRLLIGLEFAIGFLLIFLYRLRKVAVPIAASLLVFFTVYLLFLIKTYGNQGSCGCFGTVIEITPLEGIAKNIVLLFLLAVIYLLASDFHFKYKKPLAIAGVSILFILPFILNWPVYPFAKVPMNEYKHFALDTSLVYGTNTAIPDGYDITKGKHIVAFFSATCPHCRLAAKKLTVMKKQEPGMPLIFFLYNNEKSLPEFYTDTKSASVPHFLINSKIDFLKVTQGVFPRIYYVNNDTVEYENNYYELERSDIDNWLAGKNSGGILSH